MKVRRIQNATDLAVVGIFLDPRPVGRVMIDVVTEGALAA